MLGSSGAYASCLEKILKMWCSLVRFGVYFDQIVSWYTLAMGYLATGEIFKNMLQLKHFGLYFEGINRKWLLSYRNNDISYRDAREFGGMLPEKILK